MPKFAGAVTDLIVIASTPDVDGRSVQSAAKAVCASIAKTQPAQLNEGLARLADSIASVDLAGAGVVAICCGAIVEKGGNANLVLDATLSRLSEAMMAAQLFAEACEEAAADDEDQTDDTDEEDVEDHPIARFGQSVAERLPDNASAFNALEPLGMGAIAMLSQSAEARKQARRAYPGLSALADDLAAYHERAAFLSKILNVLDDERLVVLHPSEKKGYQVTIGGIATNFELFILMADALIGDSAGGWLSGKKPDPAVVAACRDQPLETANGKRATGAFNFYNWKALQSDGALPDPKDFAASKDWIWMEGTPTDIQKFEGTRVILLGPPPYARALKPGRCFEGMIANLRVDSQLPEAAVEEWLKKMNNAKR